MILYRADTESTTAHAARVKRHTNGHKVTRKTSHFETLKGDLLGGPYRADPPEPAKPCTYESSLNHTIGRAVGTRFRRRVTSTKDLVGDTTFRTEGSLQR